MKCNHLRDKMVLRNETFWQKTLASRCQSMSSDVILVKSDWEYLSTGKVPQASRNSAKNIIRLEAKKNSRQDAKTPAKANAFI